MAVELSALTLPARADRQWLWSFWLGLSGFSGLLASGIGWLSGLQYWHTGGVLWTLALIVLGFAWPRAVKIVYRLWNRLARRFGQVASDLILLICFYTTFVATAQAGPSLKFQLNERGKSLWMPRRTLSRGAYVGMGTSPTDRSEASWLNLLLSWSRQPGQLWTVCLIPFLMLLSALETRTADDPPSGIYSLY